ncbi:MAG: methyltransferase domain-containing protein [Patescibacteria group bacterium]
MSFFDNFHFHKKLEKEVFNNCITLLDLGCGKKSPIELFSKKIEYSLGVDGFEPYINESKKAKIHSEYMLSNVLGACEKFSNNSFDCVMALDLIEHLSKSDGEKLIKAMERIARKIVVIYTPNGYLKQEKFDENIGQFHLSGWKVEEMKNIGYKVFGMSGLKIFRKEEGEIKWQPKFFWGKVASVSEFIAFYFPKTSFQILCIKNVSKKN